MVSEVFFQIDFLFSDRIVNFNKAKARPDVMAIDTYVDLSEGPDPDDRFRPKLSTPPLPHSDPNSPLSCH